MGFVQSLTLTQFRNYQKASLGGLDNGFIILIGDNGAGKTNCLEAVSLLSPGRGLRNGKVIDCQNTQSKGLWAVTSQIVDEDGDHVQMGVGQDPARPDKKIIRADGQTVKNQAEQGDVLRCVWLTPQMDGLFLQGVSERRRFFDRLVATFDGGHTGRLTRYEKAVRERLNLLKTAQDKGAQPDHDWLTGLESVIAQTSVAIAAARMDYLDQLTRAMANVRHDQFLDGVICLNGDVEGALGHQSALAVEDFVKDKLLNLRSADAQAGQTLFGAHKTDMSVMHGDKNVNAAQCSTGEQKALLTTIILAHAGLVRARYGAPPVLLFDEIAAHFDARRRDALLNVLDDMRGQVWLTGQDKRAFDAVKDKQCFIVQDNQIN